MEIGGLLGLISGILIGGLGLVISRRQARKERALDEVHEHIWTRARSTAWYASLITIYILLFLALFGILTSSVKVLSILLIVHLFTWAIAGSYFYSQIFHEDAASRQIYRFLLIFLASLGILGILILLFML